MLVGGLVGAVRCATAKKFFRSDFANSDGVIDKEGYTAEVMVSSLRRWTYVSLCALVAAIGAIIVHHDQNCNPFH